MSFRPNFSSMCLGVDRESNVSMSDILYSNKYEVQQEIARGGMGIVYKAWDRILERTVALKVIHPNLADDSLFVKRFFDEARKMALLQHPNIIQIFSVEQDQDIPFLVMEYFPGANLKTYLQQNSPVEVHAAISIISQVAHALIFTHQKGIIHRDIKPANILLDDALMVKLTDFGIARAFGDAAQTVVGQLLGTVKYLSPEQAREDRLDGRSDLYALGMLFFELLTGNNPRSDTTTVAILSKLVVEGHMPELHFPTRLNIPYGIQKIIWDLLQFRPEDRILNAEALVERLNHFSPAHAASTSSYSESPHETVTLKLEQPQGLGYEPHNMPDFTDPSSDSHRGMFRNESIGKPQEPQSSAEGSPPRSNEKQGLVWFKSKYALSALTFFLLLALGGTGWFYFQSQDPNFLLENTLHIAKQPGRQSSKAETIGLEQSASNTEVSGKEVSESSRKHPINISPTPSASKKSRLAEISTQQNLSLKSAQDSLVEKPSSAQIDDQATSLPVPQEVDLSTSSSVSSGHDASTTTVQERATLSHPEITPSTPLPVETKSTENEEAKVASRPNLEMNIPDEPSSAEATATLPEPSTHVIQEEEAEPSSGNFASRPPAEEDSSSGNEATSVASAPNVEMRIPSESSSNSLESALIDEAINATQKEEAELFSEDLASSPTSGEANLPGLADATVSTDINEEEAAHDPLSQEDSHLALTEEDVEKSQGTILAQSSQENLESDLRFHVEQLQQAIVEKNWDALERISLMSESRRAWLETLYKKYESVQIDIAHVQTEPTQGRAVIHFTQGIRPNGEIVLPNKIGRIIKVSIPKNGNHWGPIIW